MKRTDPTVFLHSIVHPRFGMANVSISSVKGDESLASPSVTATLVYPCSHRLAEITFLIAFPKMAETYLWDAFCEREYPILRFS